MNARTLTLVLLWLVALCGVAGAQAERPEFDRQRAIERWQRATPEERQRLRSCYEELRRLGPEARSQLRERQAVLRQVMKRILRQLPPEQVRALEALPPEARERVRAELLRGFLEERGQLLRDSLPAEVEEAMRRAPTVQERAAILGRFMLERRDSFRSGGLGRLSSDLELTPAETAELQRLPERERLEAAMRLRRRWVEDKVVKRGLPGGMPPETWERMQSLGNQEFFEELRPWVGRGMFEGLGAAREPRARPGAPGAPGTDARRPSREDQLLLLQLRRAMRPDPQRLLELSHLRPVERRAEVERRVRAAVLEVLRGQRGADSEPYRRLSGLQGLEFRRELERLTARLRGRPLPTR